ncbi:MAG: ribbon-helix-helix protein, CopG family [Candidatus Nanohaloarchaea archaeon]|nr:ribbon-helix-helix protein, CopG family [Candidatus Nanohaloarchaea archaeon]
MATKTVSVRLEEDEFEEVETLVSSEGYSSKAELIRDLLRREWDKWAKKVEKHHGENPEDYISLGEAEKELEERELEAQG